MRDSIYIGAAILLAGCAPMGGSSWSDGRFTYVNVKSASDIAGGPRHDLLLIIDRDGRIIGQGLAHDIGTLQAVGAGLGGAVVSAAGHAGGSALVRPARNTTNVDMSVQGSGVATGGQASGGQGTASATAGSATSSSTVERGP